MAFKLPAIKLPFLRREKPAAKPDRPRGVGAPLPLIGKLPVSRQFAILIAVLGALLLLDAIVVTIDARQGNYGTVYVESAGRIRMLSQRLSKAALQASQGNRIAFKQLLESRDEFEQLVKLLTAGGVSGDVNLPPTPDDVRPALDAMIADWKKTERNANLVIDEQRNLVTLGEAVRSINDNNPALLDLAEEIAALSLQSGASARLSAAAGQLVMLTQRIAKNANTMLAGDVVDPEVAFLLGKDTNTFNATLQAMLKGSDTLRIPAATDPETKAKLGELEAAFAEYRRSVSNILGNMQRLVNAKQATRDIFNDSEALLQASEKLDAAYQEHQRGRRWNFIALAIFSLLALFTLYLIGRLVLDDARGRALESEHQNRVNQDAILQLLDEIGNLAEGDLTVRAKVTESITGAIADAINSTIDELRRVVAGINTAAIQVTSATGEAQKITSQLLQAAQKQSSEIQGTGQSVLQMAQSINEVSSNATESAKVAENSLNAAEKGAQAVQNAIRGMNDIREQIQETSKRIKRLGESSQEIGEIVQLISDITEQTNVLALNAAIQAASAGEAGRGFTVVAEEVQRLAERSAEATKHISAIVKSIQTDTQDTAVAMERSTQGVVEGTKTADSAGQALREIEQVSKQLAALIESISSATKSQAESATQVAEKMKGILRITQLTTEGTKKTAVSTGQLAALAEDLKNSVAGFKLA